jgi:hypothetical protein
MFLPAMGMLKRMNHDDIQDPTMILPLAIGMNCHNNHFLLCVKTRACAEEISFIIGGLTKQVRECELFSAVDPF